MYKGKGYGGGGAKRYFLIKLSLKPEAGGEEEEEEGQKINEAAFFKGERSFFFSGLQKGAFSPFPSSENIPLFCSSKEYFFSFLVADIMFF